MAKIIETNVDVQKKELVINTVGNPELIIRLDELTTDMLEHAALHGLKQKIVDAAALGAGYSPTEKFIAMRDVLNRIVGGDWNVRGEGGGTPTGLLFRALVVLYPNKDADTIREFLDGKSKSEQAALRKNPKIAGIIETIKAENAKDGGIDSEELLTGLEDGE